MYDFFSTWPFVSDDISTQVPQLMFIDYFSLLPPWCDSVLKYNSCLSTVGSNGSQCSVGVNTILSKLGDASVTESSDVPTQDSRSSGDKSMTWSEFVDSVDNDRSIEYKRMSSDNGTVEGLLSVSKSKIDVPLEMGKHGSLLVSLSNVIYTSIRWLCVRPGVPVCNSCYDVCGI